MIQLLGMLLESKFQCLPIFCKTSLQNDYQPEDKGQKLLVVWDALRTAGPLSRTLLSIQVLMNQLSPFNYGCMSLLTGGCLTALKKSPGFLKQLANILVHLNSLSRAFLEVNVTLGRIKSFG